MLNKGIALAIFLAGTLLSSIITIALSTGSWNLLLRIDSLPYHKYEFYKLDFFVNDG